jgi:hypothetical protein
MGSLGLVGVVFEVKTQVDGDLTTVGGVDRQLGLNKNMGRHNFSHTLIVQRHPLMSPCMAQ